MGKDAKPEVQIEKTKLGDVWDKKRAGDLPGMIDKGLAAVLKGDVDLSGSKPKQGFVLKPTVNAHFDEKKGEISVDISIAVVGVGDRLKDGVTAKGTLTKADESNLDKKMAKIVDVVCDGAAKKLGSIFKGD